MFQGRERHERRPRGVGVSWRTAGSQGLERAVNEPEPSRGARTLRTAPTRVWRPSSPTGFRKEGPRRSRAPDVVVSAGTETPREADPQALERHVSFSEGAGRRRGGRAEARSKNSEEAPNSTRVDRGTSVPREGSTRKTPRPLRTAWGERWKPARRYSPDIKRP